MIMANSKTCLVPCLFVWENHLVLKVLKLTVRVTCDVESIEKVLIFAKIYIRYWKSMEIL